MEAFRGELLSLASHELRAPLTSIRGYANTLVREYGHLGEATQREFLDTGVFSTTEIVFETGKADIKPQSEEVLGKIGAFLAAHNEIKVEVGGHTDSQGSEADNQTLSEKRAAAVVEGRRQRYLRFSSES